MRTFIFHTPVLTSRLYRNLTQMAAVVGSLYACVALSQVLPPAGQSNQRGDLAVPARDANPINNNVPLRTPRESVPDAISVLVKGFRFNGNVEIATQDLQALVASSLNKQLDFAALDRVTDVLSRYYRAKGFTVGRAYLPAQQSADGIIQINIIEGNYSAVNLKNTSPITNDRLEQMLANNLCSVRNNKDCVGKLIQDKGLERAVLLIKDLPGVTAIANLKPGITTGTSELDVDVRGTKPNAYAIGFDNFGSSATGLTRLNASADLNNLNRNGDQINLALATTTLTATTTGSATYSAPAGYEGQRVGVSFARTQYRLGGAFQLAQSYGVSNALSAYTSYPLIRSINQSLYARMSGEVRGGVNNVGALNTSFKTNANVLRAGLSGDNADGFGGGGYVVYGATLSSGYVGTNDSADLGPTGTNDGANTTGRFSKLTFSLARQQSLSGPLTFYSAVNGQRGSKNLDGSEQTALGGPNSVRGYGAEAGGSTGLNGTAELRYSAPFKVGSAFSNVTYALFYDRGWVRFYETVPAGTATNVANSRALGSYGLTLTLQSQAKIPTPTSWGYFLKGMYGMHSMNAPSTVDPTSQAKFWLQGGVTF